jgi:hypothetical protein
MTTQNRVQAKAPKFDLYEAVDVAWNDQYFATRVVRRWLDWDNDAWWYEVAGQPGQFPESALEVCDADD